MLDKIIDNGYCVGCGACATGSGSGYGMEFADDGRYRPIPLTVLNPDNSGPPVCPFLDGWPNEDEIAGEIYGPVTGQVRDSTAGYYLKNFAGHVTAGDYRRDGSSGGMVTWLLARLLESDLVDAVIHVKPTSERDVLFEYGISRSVAELQRGAKSRYYPVEISKVMDMVRDNPGRYAFVGVPCFVKAVRLLARRESVFAERIVHTVSLVCGHLKSDRFAKTMAWEMSIHPDSLQSFDFRVKQHGHPASAYGVEAVGMISGQLETRSAMTKDLLGADWGKGLFKLSACEYCDDVIGETADVSIGDAWLPAYVGDPRGTNVVTVRSPEILSLIERHSDELHLEEIGIEDVVLSQAGGFRHRREGLAYRLYLKDAAGEYRPKKRVEASGSLDEKRQRIYESRLALVAESDKAYDLAYVAGDFEVLKRYLLPLLAKHDRLRVTRKRLVVGLLRRFPSLYRTARWTWSLLRS